MIWILVTHKNMKMGHYCWRLEALRNQSGTDLETSFLLTMLHCAVKCLTQYTSKTRITSPTQLWILEATSCLTLYILWWKSDKNIMKATCHLSLFSKPSSNTLGFVVDGNYYKDKNLSTEGKNDCVMLSSKQDIVIIPLPPKIQESWQKKE